jgi:hypothetical protein
MLNEKKSYYTDSEVVGFPYFYTLKGKDARSHEQKINLSFSRFGVLNGDEIFGKIEIYGRKVENANALNGDLKISEIISFFGLK